MPTLLGTPVQSRVAGAASLTVSATVPATGARRAIRVWVGMFHNSGRVVNSVTYGGVGLTRVGSVFGTVSATGTAEQWILVDPPTGANNVVVTADFNADEIIAVASAWENVNQATPTSGATGGSANPGANPSIAIAVSGSDINVCGLIYYQGGTVTAVENGTNLAETGATGATSGWSDQYGTTSPRAWTLASSAWAAAGFVLVHDDGGAAAASLPPVPSLSASMRHLLVR